MAFNGQNVNGWVLKSLKEDTGCGNVMNLNVGYLSNSWLRDDNSLSSDLYYKNTLNLYVYFHTDPGYGTSVLAILGTSGEIMKVIRVPANSR